MFDNRLFFITSSVSILITHFSVKRFKILATLQFFKANPLVPKSFRREVGRCGGVSIGGQRIDLFPPTLLSAKRGLRDSDKNRHIEHLKPLPVSNSLTGPSQKNKNRLIMTSPHLPTSSKDKKSPSLGSGQKISSHHHKQFILNKSSGPNPNFYKNWGVAKL